MIYLTFYFNLLSAAISLQIPIDILSQLSYMIIVDLLRRFLTSFKVQRVWALTRYALYLIATALATFWVYAVEILGLILSISASRGRLSISLKALLRVVIISVSLQV